MQLVSFRKKIEFINIFREPKYYSFWRFALGLCSPELQYRRGSLIVLVLVFVIGAPVVVTALIGVAVVVTAVIGTVVVVGAVIVVIVGARVVVVTREGSGTGGVKL